MEWRIRAAIVALICAVLATVGIVTSASTHGRARAFAPDGVLFFPGPGGLTFLEALDSRHPCSASVVDSPGHDLVMTAAHCLYGNGATIEFVPGFRDGQAPYGLWEVTSLYVEPAWATSQSPQSDIAILRVAPLGQQQVQSVVGGRPLGVPLVGKPVSVSGFPSSSTVPSVCTDTLTLEKGYPAVTCADDMTGGVSGGAWVQHGFVVGVIGGYQQGGCLDTIDYSSLFTATTRQLLARAAAGGAGDSLPPALTAAGC